MEQMWAIAIKDRDSEEALYEGIENSCAMRSQFELPASKLRVGTMDSLMSLGDDLNKMDALAEATASKVYKQLDELKNEASGANTPANELPQINGVPITTYVQTWEWDEAKFQLKTPLRELAESISGRISGLEEELRTKTVELFGIKGALQQYERRTQGNLMVRGLEDVVSENDILDSDYMCTAFVVVPRHSYKEFQNVYMKLADYVVPLSAKLVSEDAEFGLWAVIIFKKCIEQFRNSAREKRFMVRDFTFDQGKQVEGAKDKEAKQREYARLKGVLISWCTVNFAEAYAMSLHLKAIRVFVESCMRYGLTTGRAPDGTPARRPNFKSYLVLPKKGRSEALRKDLAKLYSTPGSMLDGDDDTMVPGTTEFYPYVYVPITLDMLNT